MIDPHTRAASSEGKYGLPGMPLTFLEGTVIYADSAAGFSTAPQLLYQAIGAANLRPYVQVRQPYFRL